MYEVSSKPQDTKAALTMASVMQKANTLRAALHRGNGVSFGAWQMLPGTHLSRAIARAGFDWVLVDCEHGNISGKQCPCAISTVSQCAKKIYEIRSFLPRKVIATNCRQSNVSAGARVSSARGARIALSRVEQRKKQPGTLGLDMTNHDIFFSRQ